MRGDVARPEGQLLGHTEGVTHVDARGDGRFVISNAKDSTVRLWDLRNMTPGSKVIPQQDLVRCPRPRALDRCRTREHGGCCCDKPMNLPIHRKRDGWRCFKFRRSWGRRRLVPTRACMGPALPACLAPHNLAFVSAAYPAESNAARSPRHRTCIRCCAPLMWDSRASSASQPPPLPHLSAFTSSQTRHSRFHFGVLCLAILPVTPRAVMQCSLSHFDYRWHEYPHAGMVPQRPIDNSLMTFRGHKVLQTLIRAYWAPAATTGGRCIYTGSADGSVYVYDTVTGHVQHELRHHADVVRDCSWHPHRQQLVSVSWDGSIVEWGPRQGRTFSPSMLVHDYW